jgi:hypothetical protein
MVVFEGEKATVAHAVRERGGMSDCGNGGLTPWSWVASLEFVLYAAVCKGKGKAMKGLGGGNDAADAFARDTSQGRSGRRGDGASSSVGLGYGKQATTCSRRLSRSGARRPL